MSTCAGATGAHWDGPRKTRLYDHYLVLALFFIVTYYIQISSATPFFFSVALCNLLIWGKFS